MMIFTTKNVGILTLFVQELTTFFFLGSEDLKVS